MNADRLAERTRWWWGRNFGLTRGDLDETWGGRDAVQLFRWAVTAFGIMLKADHPESELELEEDPDTRTPLAIIVHHGEDHRALDVDLRGARLARLRDEAGRVVASVALSRPGVQFTRAVAGAIVGALGDMRAVAQGMELGL